MLAVIAFNTLASLTAIALWAITFYRGASPRSALDHAPRAPLAPLEGAEAPRRGFTRGSGPRLALPPALPNGGAEPPGSHDAEGEARPASAPPRQLARPTPADVAPAGSLAARLNMNPRALADLQDAQGNLPKASAERLDHAFDAGTALAHRLSLDGPKTQSLVSLATYYAYSVLREEKSVAPGIVDPERIKAITDEVTGDIRATCGDNVSAEAAPMLAALH
jgi:hypothetical protein